MNEFNKDYDKDTNKNPKDINNMYFKKETIEINNYQNNLLALSPKKRNNRKKASKRIKRYHSISINNQNALMLKEIALFGPKKYVDLNIVKYLDKKNKKFMDELAILNKNNNYRDSLEKGTIVNFLIKHNLKHEVNNDLEYFDININKYINNILDHITLKEYGYQDIIYYDNDIPDYFYYILNESYVSEYSLNIKEEEMDFENYFLYLYNLYKSYEKFKNKREFLQKLNKFDVSEDTFIDSHLIRKIVDENESIYSLFSYYDVKDAKEIILKFKIYNLYKKNENDFEKFSKENDKKYKDEIVKMHKDYGLDLSILNYDKVVTYEEISSERYFTSFNNSIRTDESFQHYLSLLNNTDKNKIKKISYQKEKNYKKFEYFGNFPYPPKNKEIITREKIVRNETDCTLVLCFNKSIYCNNITNLLKDENDKNITTFHEEYIFKDVNREYFIKKIFKNFKLNVNYKGDIIFNQDKICNNLIMLKEGIIELQMQNISLFELGTKIIEIKGLLIQKLRDYKMNNDLITNISQLEMEHDTGLQLDTVKELLSKRLNITFSRCNKGFFGEYECFFGIPSLLTGVVVSENSEIYVYPIEKYKKLNIHSTSLQDKLRKFSFNKLINILKRMYNIYNSYWRILFSQYTDKINEDVNKYSNNNNQINPNISNMDHLNINNINNDNIPLNELENNTNENLNISPNINNANNNNIYHIEENPDTSRNNNKTNIYSDIKLNMPSPYTTHTLYNERLKEIIKDNNNPKKISKILESTKNIKNVIENKPNPEKKIKIKQWDFSWQDKYQKSLHLEKFKLKNVEIDFVKTSKDFVLTKENNKNSKNKTSNTNSIKKNKNNKLSLSTKINKKKLYSIVLPPILQQTERNHETKTKYFGLKNYDFRRNMTKDIYFNNDNKQNEDAKYLYINYGKRKDKTNNFDIKKVSINFLKTRRNMIKNILNNEESIGSWGEYYYADH